MADILILHGPNLNLLGTREPEHYGHESLVEIDLRLKMHAERSGLSVATFQSNAEHELVEAVQEAPKNDTSYIIINPAGLTHSSVILRDALLSVAIPFIEVHLSNIYSREHFRQHSYFSDVAQGVISGLGSIGYELALDFLIKRCKTKDKNN